MDIANLVQATAGREQGKYFFVLETDGEYLLLADGKSRDRSAEAEKAKACPLHRGERGACRREDQKQAKKITNSELRKAIAAYSGKENQDQEG